MDPDYWYSNFRRWDENKVINISKKVEIQKHLKLCNSKNGMVLLSLKKCIWLTLINMEMQQKIRERNGRIFYYIAIQMDTSMPK